jgi:hypothetical protein
MKSNRAFSPRHDGVLAATFSIAMATTGCGLFGSSETKQPMNASVENTSGEGTIETRTDKNGNTQVELLVKHLSTPSKVAADASIYIVWIRPDNGDIQNVGALQVDDELVGKFNTTTPHRAFELMVTPEPSARMSQPTHEAVFTAKVAMAEQ